MLFILLMDVLNWLVTRAAEAGLPKPLSRRLIQHRISLYTDDVALFIQPAAADISLTLRILELFGDASGLKTNVQKSCVLPIHCSDDNCPSSRACYLVKSLSFHASISGCRSLSGN
jgi:hypothetical protein